MHQDNVIKFISDSLPGNLAQTPSMQAFANNIIPLIKDALEDGEPIRFED